MKSATKNTQKTVKFPADIARAWGCRVYADRMTGKLKAQLAPVIAALAREDFPKVVKGRRQREEIVAWGSAFVTLSKDRRKITIADYSKVQSPKSKAEELPAADKPVDGELPFLNISPLTDEVIKNYKFEAWQVDAIKKFNFSYQRRLINIYAKWEVGDAPENEKKELRNASVIKEVAANVTEKSDSEFEFPSFETNLTTLAGYYKKKFEPIIGQEFTCDKQTIKHWQAGKGVPDTKKWHPKADSGHRYWLFTNQNCFKWFEETMLPILKQETETKIPGLNGIQILPIHQERERIERKEILLRDAEIERGLGNLMDVGSAEQVFKGFALRLDAELDQFFTNNNALMAVVANGLRALFTIYDLRFTIGDNGKFDLEKFMADLADRMAKELALAYDGLKLKFAADAEEAREQIKELAKPQLK